MDDHVRIMAIKRSSTVALPELLTAVQTIAYLPELDSLLRGANLVALQARTLYFTACNLLNTLHVNFVCPGLTSPEGPLV